ncbi:hypothetical protein CRE_23833 [Caenorhabditis remanei]|uniref:Uncharacterized protein n=1 Tax=Caenorhabditis remanei TaxID=31234 RepID=E3NSY7_CAERE|nr:hypothetical protein CRE_23833 [Caenorhabditis remanei]
MPPANGKKGKKGGATKAAAPEEDFDAILAEMALADKQTAAKEPKAGNAKAGAKKGANGTAAPEVSKASWEAEIAAMKPIDEQFPDGKYPHSKDETPYYLKGKDGRVATDRESNEEKSIGCEL